MISGAINGDAALVIRAEKLAQAEEVHVILATMGSGFECVVYIDEHYAATMRFPDVPRGGSRLFIQHLTLRHGVRKVMLAGNSKSMWHSVLVLPNQLR